MNTAKPNTMTIDEAKQMLHRFYDAETTAQEESQLKQFFEGTDVPPELEPHRTLFAQLYAPPATPPQGMALRMAQEIERWNLLEKHTQRQARTTSMRWIAGVAASMLVLFTLGTYLNNRPTTANPYATNLKETYDNPRDAAGETERALTKFSMSINKGLSKISNNESTQRQ